MRSACKKYCLSGSSVAENNQFYTYILRLVSEIADDDRYIINHPNKVENVRLQHPLSYVMEARLKITRDSKGVKLLRSVGNHRNQFRRFGHFQVSFQSRL